MPIAQPRIFKHLKVSVPLRLILTVPFMLSTVGVGVGMGYLSYRNRQKAVEDLGTQLVTSISDRVTQEIENYLQIAPLVNRLNVDAVQQGQLDPNNIPALEALLFRQINQFDQVSTILFISPEGRFRFVERIPELYLGVADSAQPDFIQIYELSDQGKPGRMVHVVKGLDVRRDRSFYSLAVQSGQPVWSSVLHYGNSDALTLKAAQPAYDPETKQLVGVFGVHIRLDYLSEFLNYLDISQVGQILIVDRDGKLIATSTQEKPFVTGDKITQPNEFRQLRIDESQNELTRSLGFFFKENPDLSFSKATPQQFELSYQNNPYLVKLTPFQKLNGLDWQIITIIPKSHFMGAIEHNTSTTILLSLLTLGGTLGLGFFAANQLTSRFAQLNQAGKALAEGNLDPHLPTDSPIAELNSLSQTFNQMADQLRQSFDRISLALEESEEKFTVIFRTSPDPMAIATLKEGRLLEVNDSLLTFFGYSRWEMIGQTTLDLNLWHDLSQQAECRTMLEQKGHVRNFEVNAQTKSGAVKTVLLSSDVRTLEGQTCVIIMLRDISDRKAAELALKQSEARYRAVVDSQTESICRALPDTTLTFVNEAYCRYSNVRPEDVLGQPFINEVHPDNRAFVLQHLQTATPDNPTICSENRIIRNGKTVWMQWINQVFFDEQGNVTEIQSVGRDITELKEAEAALKNSEANLRKAQLMARLGSWEFDPITQELTWSEALSHMFGLDPTQPVPPYPELLKKYPPEDRKRLQIAVNEALANGTPYEIEHAIYHTDGTIRYVVSKGQVILNEMMQVVKLVGTALDITERKQAEIALMQSETLQRAILDAIPDLIIRMHRNGTYLDIHHTTTFPSVLPNLAVGENIRNVLPPEAAQQRLEATRMALETGETQVYEFLLQWKNVDSWQEARVIPLHKDEVIVLVRDLTERKQAEKALRESEERFRQLAETVTEGFFVFEATTSQYSYLNPACTALTGLPIKASEDDPPFCRGMVHWWNGIHPEDRDRIAFALQQEQQGQQFDEEYRFIRPNGEVRWLRSRSFPIFDENGTLVRIVGTVDDITDRKSFEAALQQSEAQLSIAQKVAQLGYWEVDLETGVRNWSDETFRHWGLTPDQPIPTVEEMLQSVHPEDRLLWEKIATEVINQGIPHTLDLRLTHPDGSLHYLETRAEPLLNAQGKVIKLIGTSLEITDRKRTEAALRESEEKFRRTFDDAPIGVSLVAKTGQFSRVNARYCELLGYSEAELLSMSFQDVTHPDDLAADQEGFRQMVIGEINAFQLEKRYVTKQGKIVPVLLNAAPIRDEDGQFLYILGYVQDIRDRLKVERMKDEFISVISHELRTPLTSIRGALGLLEAGVYDSRPEKAKRMLQIATSSSERLVRLVNEILTFERLKSNKAPLIMEHCQAEYLMQQAVESVLPIADQSNITLTVIPISATLWANPDSIIQCLTNLLSNAIKFSFPGSTIWITAEPEILNTDVPPAYLCFSVKDKGRGIPADKLEIIFEQFQQVDVADSCKKGGTGLGLAICKQIVQQHGGKIWVDSIQGEGSIFYFTLPLIKTKDE